MKFAVENMTCGHCVRTITRVLQTIYPQALVALDLAAATVTIECQVDPAQVIAALAAEGYPALPHDPKLEHAPAACCGSCH